MSVDVKRLLPDWKVVYREQEVESMPWFHPVLDGDLETALDQLGVRGGSALDLGTGPGTQALELARRGFRVTATDLSEEAVRLARERAQQQGIEVTWKHDDVLDSRVEERFDLVFDRGCFHVLDPVRRRDYVRVVAGLVKPRGHLFLKCFSRRQPGEQGPYRFTPKQIRALFGSRFRVLSIHETVYQGPKEPLPRTLFCILRREEATRD